MKCAICGCDINGYGNNPYPVRVDEDARCCDSCNSSFVVPVRIMLLGVAPERQPAIIDKLDKTPLEVLLKII